MNPMPPAYDPGRAKLKGEPLGTEWRLAVFLEAQGNGRFHTGVAYRLEDGSVVGLHLAGHHRLRRSDEAALTEAVHHWSMIVVEPERASVAEAYLDRIWKRNGETVPFAFTPPHRKCFDEQGACVLGLGEGLTCATFVLAVLRLSGIHLLDPESWPRREEDAIWQREVIEVLASIGAAVEHVRNIAPEHPALRFRPTEVAASALLHPPTVTFDQARPVAERIEKRLSLFG